MVDNMTDIVDEFVEYQQKHLREVKKNVHKVGLFKSINISSNNDKIDTTGLKIKNVLYYFVLSPTENISPNLICKKLQEKKSKKDNKLKLPKVNNRNFDGSEKVLYVGKSLKPFSTRLSQHLGLGSESTYALHLNKWGEILGKEVELELFYTSIDDIDDKQLELLETALHYKLKPILGRTGH